MTNIVPNAVVLPSGGTAGSQRTPVGLVVMGGYPLCYTDGLI